LFFVFGETLAERVDRESGRGSNGYGILGSNEEALAEWRHGRGGNVLGEIFVVDVGDVIDAEPAGAGCGVGVFAARLQVADVAFVA
jgi:hypothetical protein